MTHEERQQVIEQLFTALHNSMQVTEYDFASATPIVGRLIRAVRLAWNNVSTRWYVQHYARQQLEFQRKLFQLLQALREDHTQLEQQVRLLNDALAEKDRRLNTAQRMLERDIAEMAQHQVRS